MTAFVGEAFVWPVRVYWEDTDAGGVVYYANYLKFMERARTEWLRAMGVEQGPLQEQHGVLLVIAQIEAKYRRPARYADLLQVTCCISELGKASICFEQRVYRDQVGGELLLDGKARVGCIDAMSFKPKALPKIIVGSLTE
ncbi:MAG: tol-pal system-associated acyl-CoA thioesterase [Steroidobacteraceae bacterium]